MENNKNYGLVLEGGGAKGAYQIGVLRALEDNGFTYSAVTGTSIGALNAVILAQDGLETLEKFWHTVRISNIFAVDDEIAESISEDGMKKESFVYILKLLGHLKKFIDKSGEKMESYIRACFNIDKLINSKIKVGCVAYCVSKWQPVEKFVEDMSRDEIVDHFIASATFPLYGFYEFGGEKYVDGGVWDNMPINLVASKGYKDIVVIRTSNKVRRRKILYNDLNLHYIVPSEELGKMIEFVPKKIDRCAKVGWYDGMRFIHHYRGQKYFFIKALDDDILNSVKNLDFKGMANQGLLGGLLLKKKSANFKQYIDEIKRLTDLKLNDVDLVLYLLELLATCLKIERLEFYDFNDWLNLIKDKLKELDDEEFLNLLKPIRRIKLKKLLYFTAKSLKEKNE